MKKTLLSIGIASVLAMAQAASANTFTFGDTANNWPTWGTSYENGFDVIGDPQITGGSVDITKNILTSLSINATGLLKYNDFVAGDLFINIVRDANDTAWDYVVKTYGYGTPSENISLGMPALYDIRSLNISVSDPNKYILASWPLPADFRNNHPIAINLDNEISDGSVAFSGLTATGVTYDFGSGLSLDGYGDIVLAWTVNCANDVLYEKVPVPEPATFVMLGAGLLGLGLYGRRKKQL